MGFKDYQNDINEQFEEELNNSNIQEATFNVKEMEKVSRLLAKIASKKLGANFQFAWIDEFRKDDSKKGVGIRYMSPEGQQIRFNSYFKNASSFILGGVDYWKKGQGLTDPSLTLTWDADVNIVKLKEQLFLAIKSGKAPTITANDMVESAASDAKEQRREFARQNNIPVSYAGSNKKMLKRVEKEGLNAEFEDWMKVKTNVSEVTKFSEKADEDQDKFSDNNFYADPKYVFQDMAEAAKIIAKGLWRSLIIAGAPGIGKTYGVKAMLNQELGGQTDGLAGKWVFKTGVRTSAFGFYKTILLNKKKVVVYDDSDSIWKDRFIPNMLKNVCADDGDRWIENGTDATLNVDLMSSQDRQNVEDEYISSLIEDPSTNEKAPGKFMFEGQFINITNLPGSFFTKGDAAAVASRSIFIDVHLAQKDTLRRIATIMEFDGDSEEEIKEYLDILSPPDGSDAITGSGRYSVKNYGEIRYLTPDEARKNKALNMRSVNIMKALRRGEAKDWRRMAGIYS